MLAFASVDRPTFAGFTLSKEGYQVDSSITEAISNFPTPANGTKLRSFVGLANQLSANTDSIATLLSPLRPVLSMKNEFTWTSNHNQVFSRAKVAITTSPVLVFFDYNKATWLSTDASRQGIGFVLQQGETDKTLALVQVRSHFLTGAESVYTIIVLELLAILCAVAKSWIFLARLSHFKIISDHHPLIPIAWMRWKT